MNNIFVKGDTASILKVTCYDNTTNKPILLDEHSVQLKWKAKDKTIKTKPMIIEDQLNGIVFYQFDVNELESPKMSFDVIITNNTTGKFVTCKDIIEINVRDTVS